MSLSNRAIDVSVYKTTRRIGMSNMAIANDNNVSTPLTFLVFLRIYFLVGALKAMFPAWMRNRPSIVDVRAHQQRTLEDLGALIGAQLAPSWYYNEGAVETRVFSLGGVDDDTDEGWSFHFVLEDSVQHKAGTLIVEMGAELRLVIAPTEWEVPSLPVDHRGVVVLHRVYTAMVRAQFFHTIWSGT